MVETIAPVVYGSRARYLIGVAIHTVSATASAAALGALLGLAGSAFGAPWGRTGAAFVVALAGLYFLREAVGLPLPTFDRKRQVPDWWRTFYSPPVTAALYGVGLGIGFLTFLGHGTLVVVVALALSTGSPLMGVTLVAPFGLARGLTILATARSRDETGPALIVARLSEFAARTRWTRLANAGACCAIAIAAFSSCAPDTVTYADRVPSAAPTAVTYKAPRIVGRIEDPLVNEASGIAASRRHTDVLWVHNDSGDEPRLYCTRVDGSSCGRFTVEGADANDWEGMALGPGPGGDHLYVGDIGDNDRERERVTVYRMPEPEPGEDRRVTAERFDLIYPDGPHDAEALMVHPITGEVFIVTKETNTGAGVYAAPEPLVTGAEMDRVAKLELGPAFDPVTGGEIAPDGRRLILATYVRGYELAANDFETIWHAAPRQIALGRRPQGEAVAYSADGTAIYATTEGPRPSIWVVDRRA